jgi:cytochrome c oxidase assembly protein subunit 15
MSSKLSKSDLSNSELPSRWPHRVGALLALVVFPLIWVGGLVTTYDAGMAVPDWPGTYGYNMFLYPVETWVSGPFDLFVEHGHRLLGSLAGLIAIGLVIVTFQTEPRRWVRWMSVAVLGLVIAQGLLGGLRVLMDARVLARIHGCVGPAFFGMVTAFCVVTSRWWWRKDQKTVSVTATGLIKLATLMLIVSFCQLVVGAFLRHISIDSTPNVYRGLIWLHVGTAVALVIGTSTQWILSRLKRFRGTGIRFSANVLMLLILTQFMLGLGTYVVKFGWPVWFADMDFAASFVVGEKTFWQMNLVTAHVAVGSLILSFWTIQMLRCGRVLSKATSTSLAESTTRPMLPRASDSVPTTLPQPASTQPVSAQPLTSN